MGLVTIGLPVYNCEKYLDDCITSILNQSYRDFILLIIDDGSTDDSVHIIKSFNDDRIKFIRDNENKGLPYRLNQIAKLSKTKYLARMDSDDIMHVQRIEKQVEILENNPEIDIIGTNAYSINKENKIIGKKIDTINSVNNLVKVNGFIHPTIVGKTIWFLMNPYDEKAKRIEDYELWFRTHEESNFFMIKHPLFFYRESNGNYYLNYSKGIKSMFYVLKKYYKMKNMKKVRLWLKKTIIYGVKYIVYYFLDFLKLDHYVAQKRYSKLSPSKIKLAEQDLACSIKLKQ